MGFAEITDTDCFLNDCGVFFGYDGNIVGLDFITIWLRVLLLLDIRTALCKLVGWFLIMVTSINKTWLKNMYDKQYSS